jgi:hypothetical protein
LSGLTFKFSKSHETFKRSLKIQQYFYRWDSSVGKAGWSPDQSLGGANFQKFEVEKYIEEVDYFSVYSNVNESFDSF